MSRFERNDKSLIEQKIDEKLNMPKRGTVTQVFEHSGVDDDSNWEIDVDFDGGAGDESRVPYHSHASGAIVPPKNGDRVLVIYTDGEPNEPIALSRGWSNTDRPPLGAAGIYRHEFVSDSSPAGDGNIYINGYTEYDGDVASFDKDDSSPEETFVQIAKNPRGDNINPADKPDLPAKIEMYDSPKDDKAWITVEINKEDGSDSDATWGMKFNIKTGEWKLVGPKGFGITSDGEGNFVWEHKDITFDEVSGSTGSLSL